MRRRGAATSPAAQCRQAAARAGGGIGGILQRPHRGCKGDRNEDAVRASLSRHFTIFSPSFKVCPTGVFLRYLNNIQAALDKRLHELD